MVRKSLNEVIKLSDEQKKQIAGEVKAFYLDMQELDELDKELGL